MKIDNDPAIIYGITIVIGVVGGIIGGYKYYKSYKLTDEEKINAARGEKTIIKNEEHDYDNLVEKPDYNIYDFDNDYSDTSSMFDEDIKGGNKSKTKNKNKNKKKKSKTKKTGYKSKNI